MVTHSDVWSWVKVTAMSCSLLLVDGLAQYTESGWTKMEKLSGIIPLADIFLLIADWISSKLSLWLFFQGFEPIKALYHNQSHSQSVVFQKNFNPIFRGGLTISS